jgi:hypothetical protein
VPTKLASTIGPTPGTICHDPLDLTAGWPMIVPVAPLLSLLRESQKNSITLAILFNT